MSEKKEIKLRVPESVQAGVYANNTLISHSAEEFIIDFLMTAPPGASVVSRVVVTPGHLKRMIATLSENLEKYERKHGSVLKVDSAPMKMGFSG